MASEVTKLGIHGTCAAHAQAIKRAGGFRLVASRRPPRAGMGVYFWDNSGQIGRSLAEDWYLQCRGRGSYPRYASPPGGAAIEVRLGVNERDFIDMSRSEMHNFIDEHVARYKKVKRLSKAILTDQEYLDVYEYAIQRLESLRETRIKLVEDRVPPPEPSRRWYDAKHRGFVPCYIARDPQCIEIERILPL